MHSGNLVFILHTHLPWVLNHGKWPHGEDWLMEAVAECYVPLLNIVNELDQENISANLTFDISPVLCEQLSNKDFPDKFEKYCQEKIKSAKKDKKDFTKWGYDPHHIYLSDYWKDWYKTRLSEFRDKYNSDILSEMKRLQDKGLIEIMTCGATHGYLPLLATEESINIQIQLAVENYKKHFGRDPRGIWLPECAYRPSYEWQTYIPVNPYDKKRLRPGIEQFLKQYNIEFFVTDEKLIKEAKFIGRYDSYQQKNLEEFSHYYIDTNPLELYNVASSNNTNWGSAVCYTRHHDLAMQVWSGEVGFPAEPDYLDFHKKHEGSMLRYWRVTDSKADMMYKSLYHPDWIMDKIDKQVLHFVHNIENTANYYKNNTGFSPTISLPFDTELFGHWWFEGPLFLKSMLKAVHNSPWINMQKASDELDIQQPREVVRLPEGSWGVNNHHDVWINDSSKWTWQIIYDNELRFSNLMDYYNKNKSNGNLERLLIQALKELLIMQASDWQFLIYTKSAQDYAEQRFFFHNNDFNRLAFLAEQLINSIELRQEDIAFLKACEKRNNLFPELSLDFWKYEY